MSRYLKYKTSQRTKKFLPTTNCPNTLRQCKKRSKTSCFLSIPFSKIHFQNKLYISSSGLRFQSGLWHSDFNYVNTGRYKFTTPTCITESLWRKISIREIKANKVNSILNLVVFSHEHIRSLTRHGSRVPDSKTNLHFAALFWVWMTFNLTFRETCRTHGYKIPCLLLKFNKRDRFPDAPLGYNWSILCCEVSNWSCNCQPQWNLTGFRYGLRFTGPQAIIPTTSVEC